MKATINTDLQSFKPVSITLTIESKNELDFLWCLFNTARMDLVRIAEGSRQPRMTSDFSKVDKTAIWNSLDEIMDSINLNP